MDNAHYTYITLYIMNDSFKSLDCDEDVLLFNQDAYTVARFRELVERNIGDNFGHRMNQQSSDRVIDILSCLKIPTNNPNTFIKFTNINWISDREGINCKFLRMGAKSWQEGKLRIQADIGFDNKGGIKIQFVVEFCPDEPLEPESPLEDLRKLLQDG
ncbi:KGK domain-containing protein [Argonema galeatum]|uniref:KGK domain-containing protein n=1 Tax=Argonema galeatum TaxID=2942762 RepID=UPI0020129A78|nr:KGK domain-containing protein [Argonema galeatum]MCL1463139.1 hypothetical protein [Argonema galeatum A003/A1]